MISMIAKMAWIRRQEQKNSTCSDLGCYEDLHAVGEDYLEAVLLLNRQKGNVRGVDLADFLARSKPTITNMVTRLCEGGFLIRDSFTQRGLSCTVQSPLYGGRAHGKSSIGSFK